MPLPGGISKFCGRVYNIGRKGADFNACLGLELHAPNDIEAALRVSCFRFGPQGLRVEPAQPLPAVTEEDDDDENEDDDDDDDEYDYGVYDEDDADNDVDSGDYDTFSIFGGDLIDRLLVGESETEEDTEKPVKKVTTTTRAPLRKATRKPVKSTSTTTQKPRPVRRKPSTKRPRTTTKASKFKVTSATSPATGASTVTEVNEEPDVSDMSLAATPPNQSDMQTLDDQGPPSPHESIAAVAAMLQETPGGALSQVADVGKKPFPASVHISNMPIETPTPIASDSTNVTPLYKNATEIIQQAPQQSIIGTTLSVDSATTTEQSATTIDDEDDDEEKPAESFIIKNDDDEDDDDDPIADAVEEALDDEDSEEQGTSKVNDAVKTNSTKQEAEEAEEEEEDVVEEIISGVVDTIAGEDDETTSKKNGTLTTTEKEDEDDDDDGEEEDDDESRKARKQVKRRKLRGRQSRDMWLDRLHW